MGSRSTGKGAKKCVQRRPGSGLNMPCEGTCSLFTPGKPIWSPKWLGEIRERYLDLSEVKGGDFLDKLEGQLLGSQPEVYQLMAEALYVQPSD